MAVQDTSLSVEAAVRGSSNIEESHVGNFNNDGSVSEVVNVLDIIQDQVRQHLELLLKRKDVDINFNDQHIGTPNWNLPLVFVALTKHPFEPLESADLKFLTLKTVFLVAVASASRVLEIHSLSLDDGHFRMEGKGIKMLPNMEFLAKTQTMNRPWEPIYIPAFDSYATDSEDFKLSLSCFEDLYQSN